MTKRYNNKLTLTKHTGWAKTFWDSLIPLKDKIAHHPVFKEMSAGELSLDKFHRGLIDFYPLVQSFPGYMALNLRKIDTRDLPGTKAAKYWLIDNIKVEQKHSDWWVDWACGFGVDEEALKHASPSPLMDAINNYLWRINTYGSLIEGIGATNIAIEWATGEWSKSVIAGVQTYLKRGDVKVSNEKRTLAWIRAHALYDDIHPFEAMELIKLCAISKEAQENAFKATQRGLEYYLIALDDWYQQCEI